MTGEACSCSVTWELIDVHYMTPRSGRDCVPDELLAPRTVFEAPGSPSFVDHIGWMTDERGSPIMSLHYGVGQGFSILPERYLQDSMVQLSWRISDHYPLWIELVT